MFQKLAALHSQHIDQLILEMEYLRLCAFIRVVYGIPCGVGVGDSTNDDDDDVGVTMRVDVIVIAATVVVMVTALQFGELKIMYDEHCGVTESLSTAVDVLVLLAGVSVESCCTNVLVGATDVISVVDICDAEITTRHNYNTNVSYHTA